jgi:hypothetical protein
MIRIPGWYVLVIMSALTAVQAQNVNVTGVISNSSGAAVSGAIVTLVGLNLKDTTDTAGAYTLKSSSRIRTAAPILPSRQAATLNNGMLSVTLSGTSPLCIELFDMRGQLLDRISEYGATAGEYRFNVTRQRYATKMLLIRVHIGGNSTILQYFPSTNTIAGAHSVGTRSGAVLSKVHAAVDTLKVVAEGYLSATVGLETYEGVMNISLELESTLEKFSFFVTSMAGLQELSGSENGFGGDLRFGKTGPGAGLLGADSICACLAEMSMPGSSAKKWHAFLSAEKGVDGDTVNAIDRIGDGPWYDRLGRLVANNKTELLNPRPVNADEAIINDLPNEYGIPNHRPDPTQPIVDNHMTITGSNSHGRLFVVELPGMSVISKYGYTCDSWTSSTIRARPRIGLCWPQTGPGMKHWISAMSASGCEAGYDLDENTWSGLPNVYTIGNGGGYGGFYCFAHKP